MAVDRIHSSDTQISINGIRLTGVSQFGFSKDPDALDLVGMGSLYVNDRITQRAPKIDPSIEWTIGIGSTDPFFDIKSGLVLSIEQFNIEAKDPVGTTNVSGAYLTSYEISAGIGDLVKGTVSYEANSQSWAATGQLTQSDQTDDNIAPFLPSKIQIYSYDNDVDITEVNFAVQNFNISFPIARKSTATLGKKIPKFRYPELPAVGDLKFSVLKTLITGMSEVPVLDKGTYEIFMSNCDDSDSKIYFVENCSLVNISESLDLEGNATVDFSYNFRLLDRS